LNEGGLCREAVDYWTGKGWILLAPSQPTVALVGPDFVPQLSLRVFCGESAPGGAEPLAATQEESSSHDDA
jgi:hypothetical protein